MRQAAIVAFDGAEQVSNARPWNPVAVAACSVDAVSTTYKRCPVDQLIWCVGSSHSYPWSATQNSKVDHSEGGVKVLQKFMQRQTRAGLLETTVGKKAIC